MILLGLIASKLKFHLNNLNVVFVKYSIVEGILEQLQSLQLKSTENVLNSSVAESIVFPIERKVIIINEII